MKINTQAGFIDIFLQTFLVVAAIMAFLFILQRDPSAQKISGVASSTPLMSAVYRTATESKQAVNQPLPVEIVYTAKGFMPHTITLAGKDRAMIIRNRSGRKLQIASYPHPEHTDFSSLNQQTPMKDGESYIFIFSDIRRVYQFHNELKPEHTAVVIVD